MIPLETRGTPRDLSERVIGRVSTSQVDEADRTRTVRVGRSAPPESLTGYLAVVTTAAESHHPTPSVTNCDVAHLDDGDVVAIEPTGLVRTLYRRQSRFNTLFATERCNSLCLMCSQPPRNVDDDWRVNEMLSVIELAHPDTPELGITGGEPTLLGPGLLRVMSACRDRLPRTSLHLLSNGRAFKDWSLARAVGRIAHPDLMIGVPLYSDIDSKHDFVVQAENAFDETIRGLHNLALAGVAVEIRVVVHRHTYDRLANLAEYVYRNLTFASHVTFMGLEVIGFAKGNFSELWIDPVDYAKELDEAILYLATAGMTVSIYNHQLCTLPRRLWPYSRKSISDWKTEYDSVCDGCSVKTDCGGFFAWNLQSARSRAIGPL